MSHVDSVKEENNELLEDWTFVELQEQAHSEENEQDDDESIEVAVTPPDEEEEVTEEEEVEEEDEGNEGQKVEDIKGDEELSEKKVRKRKVDKSEDKEQKEIEAPESSEDALQKGIDIVSTPQEDLNKRLNGIVVVILVVISLLGLGHFIGIIDLSEDVEPGWSSRSLWEESLNAAQILEELKYENKDLQERILELQAENTGPIKIKGREGKEGRSLREKVNHLITENEDMRLALSRHQFSVLPDGDKAEFNKASQENHHLRKSVQQLIHLVPDVNKLEISLESLTNEHKDLLKTVGKIRHEETIPKELTPMIKQLEEMRYVVAAEAKKKNPPSSISNARSYIAYMSQVLSAFTFLHDLEDKSAAEKIDIARDIFSYWMPKGIKVPPKMQDDIIQARDQFNTVKSSIRKKWKQLKDLTTPESIVEVGQSTVAKMNRVIVNVVNKLKDIGQTTIMSTNKQFEQSVLALSSGLSKLNKQFDETWKSLEIRISMEDKENDDDEEDNNDEEKEEDSGYDDTGDDENEEEEEDINEDTIDENDDDETEEEENKKEIISDKIKYERKAKDEVKGLPKETDAKSRPQTEPQHKSTLESEEIKEEIQKQIKNKEFEKFKGKNDAKPETKHDRNDRRQNLKQSIEEKVDHRQKERNIKHEEPKDIKKDSKVSFKDKIKEKKEEQKMVKEDSRYFKGQYNKFDRVKDGADKEVPDFTKKYHRDQDDDDDDDDEDDSKILKKATGLKRHWEKPQKKSYFREQSGPKKQFIRRRGKECYWDQYRDKGECKKNIKRWEQIGEGKWEDKRTSKKYFKNEYTENNRPAKQYVKNKKSKESKIRRENFKNEKFNPRINDDQYSKYKDHKINKRHVIFEDEKQIQLVNEVKKNEIVKKKKKPNWDEIEYDKSSNSRNRDKKTKNKERKVRVDNYNGKKIDFKLKTKGLASRR